MKTARIVLYCKEEVAVAVLRQVAAVKGVLGDDLHAPRVFPVEDNPGDVEDAPRRKNSGPRASKTGIQEQILDALKKDIMNTSEITETTGLDHNQVRNAVDRMQRRKYIRRLAGGRYRRNV